jgi:hypothetical protein
MHTVSYFESFLCGIPNTTPTRSFYEPTNKRKCGVLPNTPIQVIDGSGRVYEMTIAHSCVRFAQEARFALASSLAAIGHLLRESTCTCPADSS